MNIVRKAPSINISSHRSQLQTVAKRRGCLTVVDPSRKFLTNATLFSSNNILRAGVFWREPHMDSSQVVTTVVVDLYDVDNPSLVVSVAARLEYFPNGKGTLFDLCGGCYLISQATAEIPLAEGGTVRRRLRWSRREGQSTPYSFEFC